MSLLQQKMADEEPEREERGASDAQLLGEIQARDTEVMSHLKKKDKIRALVASLQNPPVTTKSVNVKVHHGHFENTD